MARRTAHLSGFLVLTLAWLALAAAPVRADADRPANTTALVVFAAASLGDALEEIDVAYSRARGTAVKESFAASSVLAKQIEAGAPAEVFFCADPQWMDYLAEHQLLAPGSRRDVLANSLVLIAPADSNLRLSIGPGFALLAALHGGHLAMADPDSVPAGLYGRAALTKLGVWTQVAARVVRAENVRTALAFVARGEAPLGIVYRTDALADKRVRVVDVFPADSHQPIRYPLALTRRAGAAAQDYRRFLLGESARQIFAKRGFLVLSAP